MSEFLLHIGKECIYFGKQGFSVCLHHCIMLLIEHREQGLLGILCQNLCLGPTQPRVTVDVQIMLVVLLMDLFLGMVMSFQRAQGHAFRSVDHEQIGIQGLDLVLE